MQVILLLTDQEYYQVNMRKAGKWTKAGERSTMTPSRMERKEGSREKKRKTEWKR